MTTLLAIRVVISLEKRLRPQLFFAVTTNEVLRVIGVAHGRHHLPHDHFVASATVALGSRVHPLLSRFLPQLIQHGVESDAGWRRIRRRLGFRRRCRRCHWLRRRCWWRYWLRGCGWSMWGRDRVVTVPFLRRRFFPPVVLRSTRSRVFRGRVLPRSTHAHLTSWLFRRRRF